MYANTIQESVEQLDEALKNLNKDNWLELKEKCQQTSQWISHGKGSVSEKQIALDVLRNAENILHERLEKNKINHKKHMNLMGWVFFLTILLNIFCVTFVVWHGTTASLLLEIFMWFMTFLTSIVNWLSIHWLWGGGKW